MHPCLCTCVQVVYRGYHASDALQQMHDKAIQSRTTLRLNTELEETRQRMTEFRLKREVARAEKQREKSKAIADHAHVTEKEKAQAELQRSEILHAARLEEEALWREVKLEVSCQNSFGLLEQYHICALHFEE